MLELLNIEGYARPVTLNKKTAEYCEGAGLLFEVRDYCELIVKHFRNVTDIRVTLSSDPEISGYQKIRFSVVIDDDNVDDILRREGRFFREVHQTIPGAFDHFVLTTTIKYATTKIIMGSHAQG